MDILPVLGGFTIVSGRMGERERQTTECRRQGRCARHKGYSLRKNNNTGSSDTTVNLSIRSLSVFNSESMSTITTFPSSNMIQAGFPEDVNVLTATIYQLQEHLEHGTLTSSAGSRVSHDSWLRSC